MTKKDAGKEKDSLQENLQKLEAIAAWFEKEKDFDLEEGLQKVKEASALACNVRSRLSAVENEFRELESEG